LAKPLSALFLAARYDPHDEDNKDKNNIDNGG
jgi:hypothetical protein